MAASLDSIITQIQGLGGLSPQDMNSQSESLLKKQEAITDQTSDRIQQRGQQRDSLLATPVPKPDKPTLTDVPQAPVQKFENPAQVFGNAGTVLAMFGSLLTRHPLTTALNAGAAAMNAFHAGDQERLELEHKNWEDSLKTALEHNRTELDAYQTAVEDRNMSVADRMAQIEGIAAANKDDQMMAAMHAGNLGAAMDLLTARQNSAGQLFGILKQSQQMGMEEARLAETVRHNKQIEGGAGGGLDDDTVTMLAQTYLKTGTLPPMGGGVAAAGTRRQVFNKAAELAGESGGDVATNKANYGAEAASLKQMTNYINRVDSSQNVFLKNLNQVDKYATAGLAGDTPIINKWIQAGRRATGDADVAAFDTAIKTASREYARIMSGPTSNAQLTVSAQANADEMLSSAMNADQLKAVITVMKQDVENAKEAAQDQLTQIKGNISGIGTSGKPTDLPSIGDVQDGYRFKGGDPSNQDSWEQVQ